MMRVRCYYCRCSRWRLVMTGKSNGTWWCRNQTRCLRRYGRLQTARRRPEYPRTPVRRPR